MSLSIFVVLSLFFTMLLLAVLPSASTLAVMSRTVNFGVKHGLIVSLGIVAGDVIFILIAIYGLALVTEQWEQQLYIVNIIGAAYLIGLGLFQLRSKAIKEKAIERQDANYFSSYIIGLLITLGDQKAILFYLAFLPAFFDMSSIAHLDVMVILLVATASIMVGKSIYAIAASRATIFIRNQTMIEKLNTVAGLLLIVVGIFLVFKIYY